MIPSISIRTKVILAIIIFTVLLFSMVQYQHHSIIKQQIIASETAKNELLVNTALPVLALNLAFDLHDANANYLDNIANNNKNILCMVLENSDGKKLFTFSRCEKGSKKCITDNATRSITEDMLRHEIIDAMTNERLGYIQISFSNQYYERLIAEHNDFTLKFTIIILLLLALFVLFLNHAFSPLKTLFEQLKSFEPKKDNLQLCTTDRKDEVGIIQNALVEMLDRTRHYTSELDTLTKQLELKVDERTEQLKVKTEKLERINKTLESTLAEVKAQEQMLIAQSRLAAMGEMMSMVAHQWRQPLSTATLLISNYNINALLKDATRDERDDILEQISDTLIYLSETIDHFQTYFKPNDSIESVPFCNIIERTVQFTRARLDLHHIALEISCGTDTIVHTHTNEFIQVLINIINNAVDAIMETNPEHKRITLASSEDEKSVTLAITDTGGGIPEEIMNSIFEPYFSTKSKNGTGLGLYMAKMIIEKHTDGGIKVENIEGGARFTITLPKLPATTE